MMDAGSQVFLYNELLLYSTQYYTQLTGGSVSLTDPVVFKGCVCKLLINGHACCLLIGVEFIHTFMISYHYLCKDSDK